MHLDDRAVAVAIDDSQYVYVSGSSTGDRTDHDYAVVKYRLPSVSAIQEHHRVPGAFSLSQNYPNPFNPETKIRFAVPHTAHVTIRIFDVLGKEVRQLENRLFAAGSHIVQWDGRDHDGRALASGVYLVQLQAGELQATRKIMLVR